MSEPYLTTREMLARIEHGLEEVERRLNKLEQSAATAQSVRRALYAAAGSPVIAGVVAWLIANR